MCSMFAWKAPVKLFHTKEEEVEKQINSNI